MPVKNRKSSRKAFHKHQASSHITLENTWNIYTQHTSNVYLNSLHTGPAEKVLAQLIWDRQNSHSTPTYGLLEDRPKEFLHPLRNPEFTKPKLSWFSSPSCLERKGFPDLTLVPLYHNFTEHHYITEYELLLEIWLKFFTPKQLELSTLNPKKKNIYQRVWWP